MGDKYEAILNDIYDKVAKIDKQVAVIDERLKNQNGMIKAQIATCSDRFRNIEGDVEENNSFRNWMKGGIAVFGTISIFAALLTVLSLLGVIGS